VKKKTRNLDRHRLRGEQDHNEDILRKLEEYIRSQQTPVFNEENAKKGNDIE